MNISLICEDFNRLPRETQPEPRLPSGRLFPPASHPARNRLFDRVIATGGDHFQNDVASPSITFDCAVKALFPPTMEAHERARIEDCVNSASARVVKVSVSVNVRVNDSCWKELVDISAECMKERRKHCPELSTRPLKSTCRCQVCNCLALSFKPKIAVIAKLALGDVELCQKRLETIARRLPGASRRFPSTVCVKEWKTLSTLHKDRLGISCQKAIELGASNRDELYGNVLRVGRSRQMSQDGVGEVWAEMAEKGVVCAARAVVDAAEVSTSSGSRGDTRDLRLFDWLHKIANGDAVSIVKYLLWNKAPEWSHDAVVELLLHKPVFLNPYYFPSLGYQDSFNSQQWDPFNDAPPPSLTSPGTAPLLHPLFRSNAERVTLMRLQREHPTALVQVNRKLSQMIDLTPLASQFTPAQMSYLRYCEVDFAIYTPQGRLLKVVEQQRGPHHDEPDYINKDRLKRLAIGLARVEFEEAM